MNVNQIIAITQIIGIVDILLGLILLILPEATFVNRVTGLLTIVIGISVYRLWRVDADER